MLASSRGHLDAVLPDFAAAPDLVLRPEACMQDMEAMLSQWQAVPAPEAPTLPPQTPLPAPRGPGPSACSSLSALPDVPVPDMPAEGQPAAQQPTAPPGPPRSLPSDSSGPASASPGPPGPPAEPARTGAWCSCRGAPCWDAVGARPVHALCAASLAPVFCRGACTEGCAHITWQRTCQAECQGQGQLPAYAEVGSQLQDSHLPMPSS